ncbi:MAG: histidine--tRNA ligase [Acidobacteriota bacterium]|nr:histidine--tRNA ligase [Acidobacteriota bacterium]
MKPLFRSPRGTRDILPDEVERWHFVEDAAREVFGRYGFRELRTPLLEPTELFTRSVGASTDIVRKEMYTYERGDESLSLRPENTAPVVRSFVQHALYRSVAAGFPARYYYIGPMFRYERPQKGRQRQFHQIGVEVLGSSEAVADAETLEMLWRFLDALGITDRKLMLSSVGDDECRPRFREALVGWLAPRLDQLCSDCRRRYEENPLRVFDCKVEADRRLLAEAPTMLDNLCGPCLEHLGEVKTLLDGYELPYEMDARMVRGLDYYQRTVFEVVAEGLGSQNAILGGGRYDGLVEELGGPSIPGFGFAIGVERLLGVIPEGEVPGRGIDIALIALGEGGWKGALGLARRLRHEGLRVVMPTSDRPMGAQLKRADKIRARFAVFVGASELEGGKFGVKDLSTGEQVEMDFETLVDAVGGA